MAKTSDEKLKQIKELQAKKDAIMLRPDLEEGQRIRDTARAAGKTVSGYILDAVRKYMLRHSGNDDALEVVESTNGCMVEISQEVYEKARLSANYHKCSVNEFVELAITEQRKREIREFSISIKEKQQ